MHAHPAATSTNSHPRTHKTLFMTLHRPPSPPRPPLARPQTCAQSGPGARPPTRWRNRRPSTAGGRWGPVLVMDQKGRGWKRKMVMRPLSFCGGGRPPRPAAPFATALPHAQDMRPWPTHTHTARATGPTTHHSQHHGRPTLHPAPPSRRQADRRAIAQDERHRAEGWVEAAARHGCERVCVCMRKVQASFVQRSAASAARLASCFCPCFFVVSPSSLLVWWRAELLLPAPLPQTYIRTHTRPCACSDSSSTRTHIRATRRRPLPPRSLNLPLNAACRRRRAGPGWCRLLLRAGWRGRTRPVRGTVSHVEQLPGEWRAARIDGCPGAPGAKRGRTPRTAEKKKKKNECP
jgi:hypothetical protein